MLETERLRLRTWTPDDLDELHRLMTDPGVRRYLWDDVVITREQMEEVVQSSLASFREHGFGFWAVTPKGAETVIGFCGLRHFGDPPAVEVLYGLYPDYWGRGLAAEASMAVLRFGFEAAGCEQIWAGADEPNTASFRVMERLGMRYEKRMQVGEQEAVYYAITRAAFQSFAGGSR